MADVDEEDALPSNWVKRRSRRRQAQVYYFNTLTGESSWTRPAKYESSGSGVGRGGQQPLPLDKKSTSDSDDEQLFRGAAKKLMKSIEKPCREAIGKQIWRSITESGSLNAETKQHSTWGDDGDIKCLRAGSLQSTLKDGKGESKDANSGNSKSKVPELCKKSVAGRCSTPPSVCTKNISKVKPKSPKILVGSTSASSLYKDEKSEGEEKSEAEPELSPPFHAKKTYEAKKKNTSDDSLDKGAPQGDTQIKFHELSPKRQDPQNPCKVIAEANQRKGDDTYCDTDKKTSSEKCLGEVEQRDSNQGEQEDGIFSEQKESKERHGPLKDLKGKSTGADEDKVESTEKCKRTSDKKFRLEKYNGKLITVGKISKPSKNIKVLIKTKKKELLSKPSVIFHEEEDQLEIKPVFRVPKKKFLSLDSLKDKDETVSERKAEIIRKALATLSGEEYKELIGSESQKKSLKEIERCNLDDIDKYVKQVKELDPVSQITEARTKEKPFYDKTSKSNRYVLENEIRGSKKRNTYKEISPEPEVKKARRSHSSESSRSESSHSRSSQKESSSSKSSRRRSHRKSSSERGLLSKKYDVKTDTHMEERVICQPKEAALQLPEVMSLQNSAEESTFGQRVLSMSEYENENLTEAMDIETTEIISEITSFRDTAPTLDEKIQHWNPEAPKTLEKSNELVCSLTLRTEGFKPIFFVVDTNILIEDLAYIEKLCQFDFHGREIIIVVPYGAIQELDGLKQSNKVGLQSQKAIKWCHRKFLAKDKRVLGQTFVQYKQAAEVFEGQSGDDRMRDCALQLKQMGVDVVLLSNDINLLNKALLAGLDISNLESLKEKITDSITTDEVNKPSFYSELTTDVGGLKEAKSDYSLAMNDQTLDREERKNADIVDKVKVMLKGTLGKILEHYMKEMFESLWLQIVLIKPPWTLKDIFLCWEKHWLAVFIDPFPPHVNTWVKQAAVLCKKTKLTTSEVKKLLTLVEDLYKVFRVTCESLVVEPPSDLDTSHLNSNSSESSVLPVPRDILLQEQSKNESSKNPLSGKEVTTPQADSKEMQQPISAPFPSSGGTENGTLNLQEMIKRVGQCMEQYMANIMDSVAKSFSSQLEEPSSSFTLTSLQNLGQSIKTFGSIIVECLREASDEVKIKLGTFLTEFWTHANMPCPSLPFTSTDIQEFLSMPSGRNYLEEVTKELEKFYHTLESTYQRVTEGNR